MALKMPLTSWAFDAVLDARIAMPTLAVGLPLRERTFVVLAGARQPWVRVGRYGDCRSVWWWNGQGEWVFHWLLQSNGNSGAWQRR